MSRLVEGLSRFFGRVEILARGAEQDRQAAEDALARGRPLEAREHARSLLEIVPGSPVGLALWADAAEDAWLDHETVQALSELSRAVPWRADVWLRLARAGARIGWADAREALERAVSAPEERDFARYALLDLCDQDLAAGDAARAQRWLDRIPVSLASADAGAPGGADLDVLLRTAECALARGDIEAASRAAEPLDVSEGADGRVALLGARLAAQLVSSDAPAAFDLGVRAMLLDAPGAADFVAGLVAGCRDVVRVSRVKDVVSGLGWLDRPTWAASFAFAEGRKQDARVALAKGATAGDPGAANALLRLATETRDVEALALVAGRDPDALPPSLDAVRLAAEDDAMGRGRAALDRLDAVSGDASEWARELRTEIVRHWLEQEPAHWPELLEELRQSARALDQLTALTEIEALAVERQRPLRVAVVGEFNAGKSTFLNALLGVDVAPMGVVPTTAALHWVAWAPDPFARVLVHGAADRVVLHGGLKKALRELAKAEQRVERVQIYAPIERLRRVEILDTPGFNAPDPEHVRAARRAFDEAHMVVWLIDATQPLKETERLVLAEVRDLGIPIQILLNKIDRIAAEDVPGVVDHATQGLEQAGLKSYAPPVAFSAKRSLLGRLGDKKELSASGWDRVEELFSRRIVDQSDALRERAMRRKALRIATSLAEIAGVHAEQDRARDAERRERAERLLTAAARATSEAPTLAVELDRALEAGRRALAADLRPVRELPEERVDGDPGIRAYVLERTMAHLGDALSVGLENLLSVDAPPRARTAVRAAVGGACAVTRQPTDLTERPWVAVAEVAVRAFAEALEAEAAKPTLRAASSSVVDRLDAVVAALSAPPGLGAGGESV